MSTHLRECWRCCDPVARRSAHLAQRCWIMVSWGARWAHRRCSCDQQEMSRSTCAALPAGDRGAGFYPGVLLTLTYWFPAKVRARSTASCCSASRARWSRRPVSGAARMHWDRRAQGLGMDVPDRGAMAVVVGIVAFFVIVDRRLRPGSRARSRTRAGRARPSGEKRPQPPRRDAYVALRRSAWCSSR